MSKIDNDKYYTSYELAEYCFNKTKQILEEKNITEYLEPSAGNGIFLNFFDKNYLAFDIEPENEKVKKQDFLTLDIEYKKGRCIIGNPPFGSRNTLAVKFYKKAILISDYIAFILPISQLNNNQQMYEFDLIYSEDLGIKKYSNRNIHCCFNIYKRNPKGFNKKPNYKLKDITLKEYRRGVTNKNNILSYDYAICSYGSSSIGKVPNFIGEYCKEIYFKINNENRKQEILDFIKKVDWEKEVCKGSSGQINLAQWQVQKYLKENIPNIE